MPSLDRSVFVLIFSPSPSSMVRDQKMAIFQTCSEEDVQFINDSARGGERCEGRAEPTWGLWGALGSVLPWARPFPVLQPGVLTVTVG